MTTPVWPSSLQPQHVIAFKETQHESGVPVKSGRPQMIASDAGFWRVRYVDIPIKTYDEVLAFEAFLVEIDFGLTACYVPFYECVRAPATLANIAGASIDLSAAHAQLRDNATLRQTTDIYLTLLEAVDLRDGHKFQLGDSVYIAQGVTTVASDQRKIAKIWPPLRASATAGDAVELQEPQCLMHLTSGPDEHALKLAYLRTGSVSVEFMEADWQRT